MEIVDSFLWDSVVIGDNCHVYNGVLCEKVVLHKKTKLCRHDRSTAGAKQPPDFILNQEVGF